MSYFPEPDSHIRDKIKVVLEKIISSISQIMLLKIIRSCYRH